MESGRLKLLVALIWEFIRIFLIFIATISIFFTVLKRNGTALYWLISLGSFQLLPIAALVFAFFDEKKYGVVIKFVCLAKLINLFSLFLIVLNTPLGILINPIRSPFNPVRLTFIPFAIYHIHLIAFLFFFDLIFLIILLSYKTENGGLKEVRKQYDSKTVKIAYKSDGLPDFEEEDLGKTGKGER